MDLPELLGKYFKAVFSKTQKADNWVNTLKDYLSELNIFKDTHQKFLKNIRVNVGGHRVQDINKQLDIICSLDPYHIKDLMFEFDKITRKILEHIQPVIVHSLSLKKVLRHF